MTILEQLDITKPATFEALLKEHKGSDALVLLTFVTEWGGVCNVFDDTLDAAQKKYGDKCLFIYSDLDTDTELGIKYDCRSVPSYVLFKGGELVSGGTGSIHLTELWKWITIREQFFDKKG